MVVGDLITSVEQRGGVTVLAVVGEVDVATAPVLEAAIAEVVADGHLPLVIDLSALRFLASRGVAILVATREKLGEAAPFAVVARDPAGSKLIRMVGADKLLCLQETLEDALTAVGKQPSSGEESATRP